MVKNIQVANLQELGEEIGNYPEKQVVVDFWATWCPPCRIMGPILDEINEDPNFEVLKIDVDDNQNVAGALGILSIPTLLFFKDGKNNVAPFVGAAPKEVVLAHIENS